MTEWPDVSDQYGGGSMSLALRIRDLLARQRALCQPMQVPAVATPNEITESESELGFSLPPSLVELYSQVGNGGFGPVTGIFGVPRSSDDAPWDIVRAYRHLSSDPYYHGGVWPERLLPIIDCGCEVFYCIDCARAAGRVVELAVDNASLDESDFSERDRGSWPFPDHPCRRLYRLVSPSFDQFWELWLSEQERRVRDATGKADG